jgi:hypothetical protein
MTTGQLYRLWLNDLDDAPLQHELGRSLKCRSYPAHFALLAFCARHHHAHAKTIIYPTLSALINSQAKPVGCLLPTM